jgi:N-acetylglutamate synthase-like GNAT family acetyltransferase
MTSYIYVLHFDDPLKHARHYIGCTESLKARLVRHATGHGARIMRVCIEQGISWRLGSLMTCSHKRMRELERSPKDQHNSERYCSLCYGNRVHRFAGTTGYPVEMLPFKATSREMRAIGSRERLYSAPKTGQTVRLSNEQDGPELMEFVRRMMRAEKDALGFIPAGGDAGLNTLVSRGRIALAFQAAELIGYAAYTVNPAQELANIHQCCVKDEYRFMGIGLSLVQKVAETWPDALLTAKVRTDLAANHFWSAIGFKQVATVKHPTSGNLIHHYHLNQGENTLWQPTNTQTTEPTSLMTTESESCLPTSKPESSEKPDSSME